MSSSRHRGPRAALAPALVALALATSPAGFTAHADEPAGPTVLAAPLQQSACLVGEWDSVEIHNHYSPLIQLKAPLRNLAVSGNVHMTFTEAGQWARGFDNVVATGDGLLARFAGKTVGTTTGQYVETAPGVLQMSVLNRNLKTTWTRNGRPMEEPDFSDFDSSSEVQTAPYQCDGDRLLLTVQVPDRTVPPVVYQRCGTPTQPCRPLPPEATPNLFTPGVLSAAEVDGG